VLCWSHASPPNWMYALSILTLFVVLILVLFLDRILG